MLLGNGTILVLWDGKENKYVDKTKEIENYKLSQGFYLVNFYSSGKTYSYDAQRFLICNLLETIDTNDKAVIVSGTTILLPKDKDNITNTFDYFKNMAKHQAEMSADENLIGNYLYSQYQKISSVNSYSTLKTYLDKNQIKTDRNNNNLIFPFDFNMSQKVAVVSNNNTAIQNIIDKLAEKDLSFFCAMLGNKDNKTKFFDKLINDKDAKTFLEKNKDIHHKDFNFHDELELLEHLQISEIDLKKLNLDLQNAEKEYEHFKSSFKIIEMPINQKTMANLKNGIFKFQWKTLFAN
jgi:hypothetical protein